MFLTYRNVQRIVHIPFFEPIHISNNARQLEVEDAIIECRKACSSGVGHLIDFRESLVSPVTREYMGKYLLPFISQYMPNVHYRVKKCYALVIMAAALVSLCIRGGPTATLVPTPTHTPPPPPMCSSTLHECIQHIFALCNHSEKYIYVHKMHMRP